MHADSAAANASLGNQPMFCFETALKALYFSFLVRVIPLHTKPGQRLAVIALCLLAKNFYKCLLADI